MSLTCTGQPSAPAYEFSFEKWVALYPEFGGCSPVQGQAWWSRAGIICWNSPRNPTYCYGILETLLYMLTSHIGFLTSPRDAYGNFAAAGIPPAPIVGRVNHASEGSVSIGADWDGSGSPSEAYFTQSRYGVEYWQATAPWRTFQYAAQPTVVAGTVFPYVPSVMSPFGRRR